MELEGGLSREVVGLNWHAEQLFEKRKFGNQGTSPAKGYRWRDPQSPVVCWDSCLCQGVCFCRIEGRVDNQHVLGYCDIIWKLRKKCSYPIQFEGLYIGFFYIIVFLITVVGMPIKFRPSSFLTFPVKWAAVCKSIFNSDSTLQRGIALVFFTLT